MPVTRSALASRAARSAWSASAPLTMPSSTSQRASFATRSTLSATVPSFSWKTMPDELLRLLLERHLEVLLPEEAGVGSAARRARARCRRRSPRRRHWRRCWRCRRSAAPARPSSSVHDEIFLVDAHGELDHLVAARRGSRGRTSRAAAPAIRSGRHSRPPALRPRPARSPAVFGRLDRARRG